MVCFPNDTYLVVQEPLLHPVVSSYVLQDVPCELLVQLPRNEAHAHRSGGNDARDGDEEAANVAPHLLARHRQRVEPLQDLDGLLDLLNLDSRVDEQGHVGDGHADDLNGVLHAQGVPHNHHLVEEPEDE